MYLKNQIIFFFFILFFHISLFRFVFVDFVLLSLVSFSFRWFRFVSFRFCWFRFVSFRFVSFRFVFVDFASFRSFRFYFVSHFIGAPICIRYCLYQDNHLLTLSGSPDNCPDKDIIENKMPFILYICSLVKFQKIHNIVLINGCFHNGPVMCPRFVIMAQGVRIGQRQHLIIFSKNFIKHQNFQQKNSKFQKIKKYLKKNISIFFWNNSIWFEYCNLPGKKFGYIR